MKNKIAALVLGCLMLVPQLLHAEEITCSDDSGSCTIYEDSTECTCATGSMMIGEASTGTGTATSGGGGMEMTEEFCMQMLLDTCLGLAVEEECDTAKGACVVYSDGSSDCICADGYGESYGESSSGSTGEDPVYPTDPDPETDEGRTDKIFADDEIPACADVLAEECPNDPPDPAEECSSDALAMCNAMVTWYESCYEETIWPFMVIECCDEFEDDGEAMTTIAQCLEGKGCDNAEDCFPTYEAVDEALGALFSGDEKDGASGEQGGTNEDGSESDASSDDDSSDCSQASSGSALALMLLLGLALGLRRREEHI